MSKGGPKLFDPTALIQAGIDPKTGLPIKFDNAIGCISKSEIKKELRIVDEQDALNRFVWYNLPKGLDARLIERILYYRGQGAFFQLDDSFYFLPYALDGTIDVYGRFTGITPLPFTGSASTEKKDQKIQPWIVGLNFKPVYDIVDLNDFENSSVEEMDSFLKKSCVLLKDYSEQVSQTNIPRQMLNDPVLDIMSECVPFLRTALLNSTGVQGMRVDQESDAESVYAASSALNKAALTGQKYVPIVGHTEFQDLTSGATLKSEEFLLAMQALDNYRLSLYGLSTGGLFQKKSHMLESEQSMNASTTGMVLYDSLKYRQDFCTIINSIWGIGMWCEVNPIIDPLDVNTYTDDGIENDFAEPNNQEVVEDAE
jgi:hypothetical protein